MVVVKNLQGFYLKTRPRSYEASDAAYPTGGNKGWVLARLPKEYPLTAQQKKVRETAKACGIKKGMTKKSLQDAMVDCVGPKLAK